MFVVTFDTALPDESVECHVKFHCPALFWSVVRSEATGPVGCWHRVETVAGDWWPDCRTRSSTIAIVDYSDSVTPQPSQLASGTPPALATHHTIETRVVQLNIVTFYTPQCTIATILYIYTLPCMHSFQKLHWHWGGLENSGRSDCYWTLALQHHPISRQ